MVTITTMVKITTKKEFWDHVSKNDFQCTLILCQWCPWYQYETKNPVSSCVFEDRDYLKVELLKSEYKLYMEEQINKLW